MAKVPPRCHKRFLLKMLRGGKKNRVRREKDPFTPMRQGSRTGYPSAMAGVTPFTSRTFPYFAVSPVMTTAKARRARS